MSTISPATAGSNAGDTKFRNIVEASPMGIHMYELMADDRLVFIGSNPAAARILGVDHAGFVGLTIEKAFPGLVNTEVPARYREVARGGVPWSIEQIDYSEGAIRGAFEVVAFQTEPGKMAAIFSDITERKRAEARERSQMERLMQSEKLASLGNLMAGVAHEINNPNMFIMLNTPTLKAIWEDTLAALEAHKAKGEELRIGNESLDEVRHAADRIFGYITEGSERMKNIVKELKQYARTDPQHMDESVDINKVIRSAVTLVNNRIKSATDCFVTDYAEALPRIHGNSQRIEQAGINLLLNACDALPDRSKSIRVITRHDAGANAVIVQVIDEGCGMTPEVLANIRDPFFTTKRDTGGTGLGVSIVSRIAEDHGGAVAYESQPGKGTTATVTLPVVR